MSTQSKQFLKEKEKKEKKRRRAINQMSKGPTPKLLPNSSKCGDSNRCSRSKIKAAAAQEEPNHVRFFFCTKQKKAKQNPLCKKRKRARQREGERKWQGILLV